jgi:hypothetical protein
MPMAAASAVNSALAGWLASVPCIDNVCDPGKELPMKSKLPLYIGIAAGAAVLLAVIGGIVMYMKKKKAAAARALMDQQAAQGGDTEYGGEYDAYGTQYTEGGGSLEYDEGQDDGYDEYGYGDDGTQGQY